MKEHHLRRISADPNPRRSQRYYRYLCYRALAVLCVSLPAVCSAQVKSSIDLRFSVGWRNNATEGTCSEGGGHFFRSGQFSVGGSVRYHFTPRVGVGPELSWVSPCQSQTYTYYHPRLVGTMNAAFDFNRSRSVRPYFVTGVGFLRHRRVQNEPERFRWEVSGGLGAKLFLSDRTYVAPEATFGGIIPFVRFSSSVGTLVH